MGQGCCRKLSVEATESDPPSDISTPSSELCSARATYDIGCSSFGASCLAGSLFASAVLWSHQEQRVVACTWAAYSTEELVSLNIVTAQLELQRQAVQALSRCCKDHHWETIYYSGFFPLCLDMGPEKRVSSLDHQWEPCVMRAYENARGHFCRQMQRAHEEYPTWGFQEHWGEDTKAHRERIVKARGGTPYHRIHFAPLRRFVSQAQPQRATAKIHTSTHPKTKKTESHCPAPATQPSRLRRLH